MPNKKKFHAIVDKAVNNEYYSILVSSNGKTLYTSETKKRKSSVIKTIKNLFPDIKIVDRTLIKHQ